MISLETFKCAIVRITNEGGQVTHGMGIVVSPQRILTCAHVVAAALGEGEQGVTEGPRGNVRVIFPFVDDGAIDEAIAASVLPLNGWYPCRDGKGFDLAVLQVEGSLAFKGCPPISPAISLYGVPFWGWGAPPGHDRQLISIKGDLQGERANGRYVVSVRKSNYKIGPGCSGAPVVDPTTGLILGLIAQRELDADAEAGFLIPASQLRSVLRDAGVPESVEQPDLEALRAWAEARYRFRWGGQQEVLRFIDAYKGWPDDPKPFVGRGAILEQLDRWLDQSSRRFLLLSGKAGRGKSTLLLHWLARQIQQSHRLIIFYLPISIRFNTADEITGVQLLFAALSDVFGGLRENFPQKPEADDYVERIASGWDHIGSHSKQQFLLVVDGLDEATNQWFLKRAILPSKLPTNLHVLISARHKPGHESGASWLRDFGDQVVDARDAGGEESPLLEVPTLDQRAMADAVMQLGHPLDQLAERQTFVQELYRLTESGDPLLLTLWLGQIWRQRECAPDLEAQTLARLQPSFGGFYKLWKKDQQTVWEAQGFDIHGEDLEQVMYVLAVAQGPMLLSDLVAVLGHLKNIVQWEYVRLRSALESAHRLVVGDGNTHGYVLVHPRLAQYFQERLDASQSRAVRRAFRAWGADTLLRLNSGELLAEDCPCYLLNHYVAAHIEAGEVSGPDVLEKYHMPLLRQGWAMAWHAHEGAWLGYLNDLARVVEALHLFNQACVNSGRFFELRLSAEVRCALLAATIRSFASMLPFQLILSLARERVWSVARAARVVMLYEPRERAECLAKLAAVRLEQREPAEARYLLRQVLDAAVEIQDQRDRARALSAVAAQLLGESALLERALNAAAAIQDEWWRATALSAVATQLQGESALLEYAFKTAAAIQDKWLRAKALSAAAAHLQGEARRQALRQALEAAATIKREAHVHPLSEVVAQLRGESALLEHALEVAASIRDPVSAARAFIAAAAQLEGEARHEALQEALEIVAQPHVHGLSEVVAEVVTQVPGERAFLERTLNVAEARIRCGTDVLAVALSAVAARLRGEGALLERALKIAAAIRDEVPRARALSQVAVQLQGEARQHVLRQALEAAAAIRDEKSRAEVLCNVMPRLQGENALLEYALKISATIRGARSRAEALSAAAAQLQGEARRQALSQALEVAAAIQSGQDRTAALSAVAARLQGEGALLERALEVAAAIRDERPRAVALSALAAHLQGEARHQALQEVLEIAAAIRGEWSRAEVLSKVAPGLRGEGVLLERALEIAAALRDEAPRARALSQVAVQLQGEARQHVLRQALEAAGAIRQEEFRAGALSKMAPGLQGEGALLGRALEVAAAIRDERLRAAVLSKVASGLQGEDALLERALEIAAVIRDEAPRACALSAVAAQLHGEARQLALRQTLEAAAAIRGEESRAEALSAAAAQLEGKARHQALRQALGAAAATRFPASRVRALTAVATQLRGKVRNQALQEALEFAAMMENERSRTRALSVVATQLQGEARHWALQEALETVAASQDKEFRALSLSILAAQLEGHSDLQAVCVKAVIALSGDQPERIAIAAAITRQNSGLLTYDLWFDWLKQARLRRHELLGVLYDLTQSAVQLTGRSQEAEEIAAAVHDVGAWWP